MPIEKTPKTLKSKTAVKMLSIFLGIITWFTVLNANNPTNTRIISVPINLANVNSFNARKLGIRNTNYLKEVTITIEGRRNDLSEISEKNFSAFVDMNGISAEGLHALEININAPEDSYYFIKDVYPKNLQLEVETIVEKPFPVEVVNEGEPAENYIIIESTAFPGDIAISSLNSVISSINNVVAYIDVSNINRNISYRKFCNVYSIMGEERLEFKDKFSVEVNVRVAKKIPVVPVITGKLGNNAFESTRQVHPQEVYVTGNADVLSQIERIFTTPIDITGVTYDVNYNTQLVVPDGISLYNTSPDANVSISVGLIETSHIVVTAGEINIKGKSDKYTYDILTPEVDVSIKGLRGDIDLVNVSALNPEINVELLKEGTHRLAVELSPPEDITLMGSYFVEVEIASIITETTPPTPDNTTPDISPAPSPEPSPSPEVTPNT